MKPDKPVPVFVQDGNVERRINIELQDFPSTLFLMHLGPPPFWRLAQGLPPEEEVELKPWYHHLSCNDKILKEKYDVTTFSSTLLNLPVFCRMLGKIAHSYTVARLGLDGFQAFLPDLIRDEDFKSRALMAFVGGDQNDEPISDAYHVLGLRTLRIRRNRLMLAVRIRLFAIYNSPTYLVIVGAPLASKSPTRFFYTGDLSARKNYYRVHSSPEYNYWANFLNPEGWWRDHDNNLPHMIELMK